MYFVVKEKERKSIARIIFEIVILTINEKQIPRYYFRYYYYLTKNKKENMYSRHEILKLYNSSCFRCEDNKILDDKISFYHWCKENNLPTPYTFEVKSNEQLQKELSFREELFLKPNYSMQGKGCHVIHEGTVLKDIDYRGWVAQENIEQDKRLSIFNKSSLNTMRVHTFKKENGEIEIFSSYFRFGDQGSHVDNVSSGGYYIPFDFETWKLAKKAYSSFDSKRNTINQIPGTNIDFRTIEIPFEKESKKLIISAAKSLKNKIVGWDLAFTQNGPVLIEGNAMPDLNFAQNSVSGLKNIVYLKEFFDQYL